MTSYLYWLTASSSYLTKGGESSCSAMAKAKGIIKQTANARSFVLITASPAD
jgi:hypothetical protein